VIRAQSGQTKINDELTA